MKRTIASYAFLACLAGSLAGQTLESRPPQAAPTPGATSHIDATYVKLRNIHLGQEAIRVSDFTLRRDAGTFVFKSGVFYLLEPVSGKITGAAFLGEGEFTLTPPIEVERRNLSILTRGQPFDEKFTSAVFRFTDGSEDELRKAGTADSAPANGDAAALLSDIQMQLRKKIRDNLSARLLEDVLSSQPGGKFIAFIKGKNYSDKMVYDVDPHGSSAVKPEEVSLLLWDENHAGIWAGFHVSKEYAAGTANSDEQNGDISIEHQKLDTSIAKNAFLTGTAETSFTALRDGVRVVPLDLFPTLRVASVTGQNGEPLSFIQEDKEEDADFAVILPRELEKGESYTITTKYGGKDAVKGEGSGNYYPIARENWYPGLGFGSYATYDMTFRIPKGMTMVGTGTPGKNIDEGNENISQWSATVPQAVAGFNFGRFKRDEGKPLKQPYVLETYANPDPPDVIKHSNSWPIPPEPWGP